MSIAEAVSRQDGGAHRALTRQEFASLRQSSRVDLRRSTPFTVTRDGEGDQEPGDGLTMEGDAAVFNQVTVIDSWEGRFKEQLLPGSWKKTLREITPRVQFDHGSHPMIGSIPIGTLRKAYEDGDRAVHTVTRLLDNWLVQPVRDALAEDAINGMSFRFSVVREEWRHPDGKLVRDEDLEGLLWETWVRDVPEGELLTRSLKEVKVFELGPVVWPAYAGTSVGVRSKTDTFTIDFGRLDRTEERAKLARAVMLADRADRKPDSAETPEAPPEGHPADRSAEPNDAPLVDGHPSDSTTRSIPPDGTSAEEILGRMQATLTQIHERSSNHG